MDDIYEALQVVHVIAAVVWVGGGVSMQILGIRAQRAGNADRLMFLGREIEFVGKRIFLPASIVVLLLGIAMVIKAEPIGFGDPWILLGLGGIIVSAVVGAAYLGPQTGKLAALVEQQGAESPDVRAQMNRVFLASRLDLLILIGVVVDMVVKPGSPLA